RDNCALNLNNVEGCTMQETSAPFEENPKILDWEQTVDKSLCPENAISKMNIAPRTPLVGDWLKAGDLGFILAARGIGKSWLAMLLAKGLANQTPVGPWKSHARVRVLYLDGEMAIEDVQLRIRALGPLSDDICYLNHYVLFEQSGHTMNLADYAFQHAVLNVCLKRNFNVLICDNLSTLSSGIDENKSLDWELIQNWLLELRRNNITVIIVHHAGRNN